MGKVKRYYIPMVMAFDTETTSYKDESGKRYAWMYIADFCKVVGIGECLLYLAGGPYLYGGVAAHKTDVRLYAQRINVSARN